LQQSRAGEETGTMSDDAAERALSEARAVLKGCGADIDKASERVAAAILSAEKRGREFKDTLFNTLRKDIEQIAENASDEIERLNARVAEMERKYERPGITCGRGHVNILPVSLWNCPICTDTDGPRRAAEQAVIAAAFRWRNSVYLTMKLEGDDRELYDALARLAAAEEAGRAATRPAGPR
jgi:hypothetical protein